MTRSAMTDALTIERLTALCSQRQFNLIEEPWLKTVKAGAVHRVGLRELFEQAHEADDLVAETEPEYVATIYFLTTVLIDLLATSGVAGGRNVPELLDPKWVGDYFDACEDSFWLIHPAAPFLQQAKVSTRLNAGSSVIATNSVKALEMHLGGKTNPTYWSKVPDDGYKCSPARAAVLAIQRLILGSAGNEQPLDGYRTTMASIHGIAPGLRLALRRGRKLLLTLLANIVRNDLESSANLSMVGSGPLWPRSDLASSEGTFRPIDAFNVIERRLWSPHALLLIPRFEDGKLCISEIVRGPRASNPKRLGGDDAAVKEVRREFAGVLRTSSAHVITFRKGDGATGLVRGDRDRGAWRDLGAIHATIASDDSRRGSILNGRALAFPSIESHCGTFELQFRGNATGPVVDDWYSSTLENFWIQDFDVLECLQAELDMRAVTGQCKKALDKFCKVSELKELRAREATIFWDRARERFEQLNSDLLDLSAAGRSVAVPPSWRLDILAMTAQIGEELSGQMVAVSPSQMVAVSAAHRVLQTELRKITKRYEEQP